MMEAAERAKNEAPGTGREDGSRNGAAEAEEPKARSAFYEYAESIVIALVLALLIRHFVVQAFKIPTGSMQPTLEIGDHLLVSKFLYGTKIPFTRKRILPIRQPLRGDIIVFQYPDKPEEDYIKRVIGLPGDTIEVRQRKIFVNDEPIDDPWGYCLRGDRYVHLNETGEGCPSSPGRDNFGPYEVPANRYFMMGDNRDNSKDSRFWGTKTVPEEYIKGKAWVIYWSQIDWTTWPRWGRTFMLVR